MALTVFLDGYFLWTTIEKANMRTTTGKASLAEHINCCQSSSAALRISSSMICCWQTDDKRQEAPDIPMSIYYGIGIKISAVQLYRFAFVCMKI